MSPDIFISHSSQNKDVADIICKTLEESGLRCWIAPRDVTPGVPYAEAILKGIYSSRLFLMIFSEASNASPQVLREVERAVAKNIPLLTVKIEEAPMTPSLEYFLSAHHWFVAVGVPLEIRLPRLFESVNRVLAASSTPRPGNPGAENRNPSLPGLYQLRVVSGPDAGKVYPLCNERITVGRSDSCDVLLVDSAVSRCVCSLNWDDASCGFVLVDHASVHGVFLNGTKVGEQRRPLALGDRIQVGRTVLLLESLGTSAEPR
jgi:hypothetical protein